MLSALAGLREGILACSRAYDSSMERLLPLLMQRMSDQKESVKAAAADTIEGRSGRGRGREAVCACVCM